MVAVTGKKLATVTLPTDEQILITREFDAPKRLVYRAWTTPELVKRWWSGQRGKVISAEIDLRVGGSWRYVMVANNGLEVAFHGEYREIVENELIACTEVYEAMPSTQAVTTATFSDTNTRTLLTLLVQHTSEENRDQHLNSGMEAGMQESMDLLERVAVSLGEAQTDEASPSAVLPGHDQRGSQPLGRLDVLVGEWTMEALFPNAPGGEGAGEDSPARTTFEWLPGRQFLIQRWEVPHPAAPDGIAVIGFHQDRQTYLQHYFDSRGVARLYEMSLANGIWTLLRTTPDFSPLDFSQRYAGTFSKDLRTIHGSWHSSTDGTNWTQDFELNYTKTA